MALSGIATITVTVAILVLNLLGDSALYFYNADEAVARREELGTRRFTIQGTPLTEPMSGFQQERPVISFAIGFNDVVVDVVHFGDPPELFQVDVPVVLEGSWKQGSGLEDVAVTDIGLDSWHFASDRMLVKHDNDYRNREDYSERIAEAESYDSFTE